MIEIVNNCFDKDFLDEYCQEHQTPKDLLDTIGYNTELLCKLIIPILRKRNDIKLRFLGMPEHLLEGPIKIGMLPLYYLDEKIAKAVCEKVDSKLLVFNVWNEEAWLQQFGKTNFSYTWTFCFKNVE